MSNNSTTKTLSSDKRKQLFKGKEKKALAQALDIRKFEIDLYWKRATYFWAFIAATFAGFIAIQSSTSANKTDMSVILSCLGVVFSFAWFCVNRGSKYWQENWEKHVDLLEDEVTGPLYKVVLSRNPDGTKADKARDLLTGPSPLSVSKINQLISLYVTVLWCSLLVYSLPEFSFSKQIDWFYVVIVGFSIIACGLFVFLGRSYGGGYYHNASLRKSRVNPSN
ncbi:RipA family octameric membrane protein [Pseudoalteromonas sp. CH_XMU1449-3]|uniref:RipA family octameric membrane protein n=1 Tax=Pseudoalteromonas sp. CH_XMU1449-3 TaxID=3107774 RepID=UPI00300A6697